MKNMLYRLIKRVKVIWFYLLSFRGSKARIMNAENTIKDIREGKSLIRFGDGEFGIYKKRSIHYQNWSDELYNKFVQIKRAYENGEGNFLLAVPQYFMSVNGKALLKSRAYIASWSEARYFFKTKFNQNLLYGDAFLFQKGNEYLYDLLWDKNERCQNVIFIHHDEKYCQVFKERYSKNTYFVQCPAKNTFEELFSLYKQIDEIVSQNTLDIHNTSIVVSAGPAGKVIVYEYSQKGFWCIDTGHCWDEPLKGDTQK